MKKNSTWSVLFLISMILCLTFTCLSALIRIFITDSSELLKLSEHLNTFGNVLWFTTVLLGGKLIYDKIKK